MSEVLGAAEDEFDDIYNYNDTEVTTIPNLEQLAPVAEHKSDDLAVGALVDSSGWRNIGRVQ